MFHNPARFCEEILKQVYHVLNSMCFIQSSWKLMLIFITVSYIQKWCHIIWYKTDSFRLHSPFFLPSQKAAINSYVLPTNYNCIKQVYWQTFNCCLLRTFIICLSSVYNHTVITIFSGNEIFKENNQIIDILHNFIENMYKIHKTLFYTHNCTCNICIR